MKKIVLRLILAALLLAAVILAIKQPPSSYYPALAMEAADPAGVITLGFLFEARPSLTECEHVTGNIARRTLQTCPSCRITQLSCDSKLTNTTQSLLGNVPIEPPLRSYAKWSDHLPGRHARTGTGGLPVC
jgi:hypothetical protein